jgi:hypothetical protein
LAAGLKQQPGVDVKLVDGNRGELTVLVNDRVVAKKGFFSKPSVEDVLASVQEASSAKTESKV